MAFWVAYEGEVKCLKGKAYIVSRWQIISVNSREVSEETDIKVGNSVCVKWFQKEFWTGTVISCLFDKSFIQESADQFEEAKV